MMKRATIALILLAPLGASRPGELDAQESARIYEVRECGRIGIAFAPSDPLVVDALMPNSPAARAGIEPRDTVVAIDGERASQATLPAIARRLRPGRAVRVRLRRGGRAREIDVVPAADVCLEPSGRTYGPDARESASAPRMVFRIGADSTFPLPFDPRWLPPPPDRILDGFRRVEEAGRALRDAAARSGNAALSARIVLPPTAAAEVDAPSMALLLGPRAVAGVEFSELNPQLAQYFDGATEGLLVLRVAPGTPGHRTGLQPGDVVVRVDGRPVHGIAELRYAVARAGGRPVTLTVVRRGEERRLVYRRDG